DCSWRLEIGRPSLHSRSRKAGGQLPDEDIWIDRACQRHGVRASDEPGSAIGQVTLPRRHTATEIHAERVADRTATYEHPFSPHAVPGSLLPNTDSSSRRCYKHPMFQDPTSLL